MTLVRQAWIDACHFHDLTEAQVLAEVSRRVKGAGAHPLVLLDLDSTLYEVGPRTHQILKEWVDSDESRGFDRVRKALTEELRAHHVGYSLKDTFGAIGLPLADSQVQKAWESAKKYWSSRFFSSEYLKYDHAYPGAAHFTREVHDLGAEVVYLTGRDEPGMGDGTRANLIRDGFPWEKDRTHLLMKERASIDDLDHKTNAAHYIRKHGTLVASFENEPPNLVALSELFPDAMHVFVETVCSDRPAAAAQGLYRIKGFGK